MQLEKLTEERIYELHPYLSGQTTRLSVYSGAYLYGWTIDYFAPDFCIVGRSLVLKSSKKGREFFFYPISETGEWEDELPAIEAIEDFCREKGLPLAFLDVPEEKIAPLCARYSYGVELSSPRAYEDYLYDLSEIVAFEGKKFAGQRNHVKRFYKACPDATFKLVEKGDEGKIRDFLDEFERTQFTVNGSMAEKEFTLTRELFEKREAFHLTFGYMETGGKVVSIAAGEVCGDTLIEDVEKALRGYEGVYPATAQAFCKAFEGEAKFLNREDDSAVAGLRKSKLQYNPIKTVKRFCVKPRLPIVEIEREPTIKTERLTIKKIAQKDGEEYARLAGDIGRNAYWGYDYRNDLPKGVEPNGEYFLGGVRAMFKAKTEMALGIYKGRSLVGEVTLYNFGYARQAEVGVRVLPEHEGKGYAKEAVSAMIGYALLELGLERVEAKCYKANERSKKTLLSVGMKLFAEDEKFFRFYKTAAM